MSGFDEWFDGNKQTLYEDDRWIAKKAWDARQAEIDEITKQRDSFIKAHHIAMNDVCELKAEIDELQKRIDDALNFYNIAKSDVNIGMIKMASYLKGNQNEN